MALATSSGSPRRLSGICSCTILSVPGEIDTAILSPGTDKIVQQQIPLRRLGEPEEVAKAIYFLCTDQSSYVNGAELHIDGGQHV